MQLKLFNLIDEKILFIYDIYNSHEDYSVLKFIAKPTLIKNIYKGVEVREKYERFFRRIGKTQFKYIY